MAVRTVALRTAVSEVADLLDSPEIASLISELDDLRWTGRRGYGAKTLLGACLVKSLYCLPTWTRTARLIAEHPGLSAALGGAPSEWACYRFAKKLRENRPALNACLDACAASLRAQHPDMGRDVAIDASDLPAYANGQRYVSKGGGFYGYKLHAVVCARTDLPLSWRVETAKAHEYNFALPLIDAARARGFAPETAALDKGYDQRGLYDALTERGCLPIIPLKRTPDVKREPDTAPRCEHGRWTFAGADFKRGRAKWRCPTGGCQPKSKWVKADRRNPLVPRETRRWRSLYRGRAAVEREFGRLKNEYGLKPLGYAALSAWRSTLTL